MEDFYGGPTKLIVYNWNIILMQIYLSATLLFEQEIKLRT